MMECFARLLAINYFRKHTILDVWQCCEYTSGENEIIEKVWKDRSSRPELVLGKVFWKYAENLEENTHAKVWFQ